MKKQRLPDQERLHTGVYYSGMIATLASGPDIILFNTDIGHAGEWIDEILRLRPGGLAPPQVMSDALLSNHVTVTDVMSHFPVDVKALLEPYAFIWQHETQVEKDKLSASERLAYHQQHSLPVKQHFQMWGEEVLAS